MKKFQDLTLKDNFMFCAAMTQDDNCRKLLELILNIPIKEVKIDYEKNMIYHPNYHGIRLDIVAKDEDLTHYNVEMQVLKAPLKKRSRYYHSQIDMGMLLAGQEYEKLPDVYVIFICDFDPFGYQKYKYTKVSRCLEEPMLDLSDGSHTIYLSTHGKFKDNIPEDLIKFLKFVKEGPSGTVIDDDPTSFIQTLQNSINRIKADRSMEEKFMLLEEMLRQERKEGIEEGIELGRQEGINSVRRNILLFLEKTCNKSAQIEAMLLQFEDIDKLNNIFSYILSLEDTNKTEKIEEYIQSLL